MPNKNYIRGRAKEYRVMAEFRKMGYDIVARTAGSHSPIDVIAIKNCDTGLDICLVQCKPKSMSASKKQQLTESLRWLTERDDVLVKFWVE